MQRYVLHGIVQLYVFRCDVGQFGVIFGSLGLSLMGHQVIQVNKCDTVTMLLHNLLAISCTCLAYQFL